VTTPESAAEPPMALVSTRSFRDGFAAFQAFRPRWHIEDDAYRELKEGWGLEKQHWGRDFAAVLGRTTLTCLAFNTAQVSRLQAGARLAALAIRRLRRLRQRELGTAPAVIYVAGWDARLLAGRIAPFAGDCSPRKSPACFEDNFFLGCPHLILISKCLPRMNIP
jgi:hypothetical protein